MTGEVTTEALLPFAIRMGGWLYLAAACVLGAIFIGYAVALHARYSDRLAQRCFRYSIVYLAAVAVRSDRVSIEALI